MESPESPSITTALRRRLTSAPERQHQRNAAEEAALVLRLRDEPTGQPLNTLYRTYGRRLYGLGFQLLGDRGLAEELVQETFVRLWRNAARFDPERGSVRTFIFTIARRVAVDLLRRSSARPRAAVSAEDLLEEAHGGDVFDQLLLGMGVRQAMSSLSPHHQEVLRLHYDEDLSQRQIAERLSVPLGTVKTRAYHALRALRVELEEQGLVS